MLPPTSQPPYNRTLVYLAVAGGLAYVLYLLAPILAPFLLSAGLAYLCDPLVDRLERAHVPRSLGTLLIMLGLLFLLALLLAILAPLAQAQFRLLMEQVPGITEWVEKSLLPWISQTFGIDLRNDQALIIAWMRDHIADVAGLTKGLPRITQGGMALVGVVSSLLLTPVVMFYLLRDWDRVLITLASWIPEPLRPRVIAIMSEVDVVMAEFVRGQLGVIAIMCLLYSLGLWLIGLDYALAVGVISGVLVFVPYLGVIVGVALGTLAGWTQFGDFTALIQVWAVFAVGQLLESLAITPWLVGERVGLHPVVVIFALMAFGHLFGFFGVLLAIPAASALLVVLRHLKPGLSGQ
ncbi:MAG: AI-2E family transporter [Thiobacillaceae bacterium]